MKGFVFVCLSLLVNSCSFNTSTSKSSSLSSSSLTSTSEVKDSISNSTTSSVSSSTHSTTSTFSTSLSEQTSTTSSTSSVDTLPEFDRNNRVTITFWHTMGDSLKMALKSIISEFNDIYPNIEVEHTSVGGYSDVRDAILKNIPNGSTPNLSYCYPEHVALYRNAEAIETLDSYISNEEYGLNDDELNSFVKGFYDEGKSFGDDKMYSLPFMRNAEVLFYNKTFFDENNLSVPSTWDELWETCRKIKEIDPNSIPLGYDYEANWFITNAKQNGYEYTAPNRIKGPMDHLLFNNEGNRNFVSDLKEKYEEGLFTTKEMLGTYTSGLFTADSNKSYLSIVYLNGAQYQWSNSFETGVAPLPQTSGGTNAAYSRGPSICMFNKEDQQEEIASWLFLKYLTTNAEAQSIFAQASSYIPVVKTAYDTESYKTYLEGASGTSRKGVSTLAAKVAIEQVDYYFATPSFVGSGLVYDEIETLIVKTLSGKETDEAFSDAIDNLVSYIS